MPTTPQPYLVGHPPHSQDFSFIKLPQPFGRTTGLHAHHPLAVGSNPAKPFARRLPAPPIRREQAARADRFPPYMRARMGKAAMRGWVAQQPASWMGGGDRKGRAPEACQIHSAMCCLSFCGRFSLAEAVVVCLRLSTFDRESRAPERIASSTGLI
jgi:hypothetical protein